MNSNNSIKPGNRITWRHRYDRAKQGHIVYRGLQRYHIVFTDRESAAAAARRLNAGSGQPQEDLEQ